MFDTNNYSPTRRFVTYFKSIKIKKNYAARLSDFDRRAHARAISYLSAPVLASTRRAYASIATVMGRLTFVRSTLSLAIRSLTEVSYRCRAYERSYGRCATRSEDHRLRISGINLYSSDVKPRCWQCNCPRDLEIFCPKCKALQEPTEDLNYFQVIGIKEDYDIESKDMQRKYRELQNKLHPDRFSNRTEKEKEISMNMSSLINKAYNTLLHPLERGLYMLSLNKVSIPEGTTSLEPEFLMEIMERNEKVEEASEDKDKIISLMEENDSILNTLSQQVSEAFGHNDIERSKLLLIKMKYYSSLQGRLKNLKRELGIVD